MGRLPVGSAVAGVRLDWYAIKLCVGAIAGCDAGRVDLAGFGSGLGLLPALVFKAGGF